MLEYSSLIIFDETVQLSLFFYMKLKTIKLTDCDVTIPVPQNYTDCIELLKSDYFRIGGG